jgi:hypothetical protein
VSLAAGVAADVAGLPVVVATSAAAGVEEGLDAGVPFVVGMEVDAHATAIRPAASDA